MILASSIFSVFSDPAGALWKEIAKGISAAIMAGIKGLISGLIRTIIAMIQHTSPQFAKTHYSPVQPALFSPVWHVMVIVGVSVAVLIMFIGVISSILKGETGLLLKQLAFGLIAVMAMASPVPPLIAQAIFSVIQVFSKFILDAALAQAGHAGFFNSTTQSAIVAYKAVAIFTASNPAISLAFVALIGVFTALAAAAVWFELLAREAIAYLIMGLFPLALAGMFYKGSSRWLRRAVEGLLAVALGQIVIAILFAFAVSSLLLAGPSMSLTNFGLFGVFMFLAALGLPIAMRVAPMAFEFGEAAFHASSLAGSARGAVAAHTTGPAKAALTQRLHAPLVNKISGKNGKPGGGSGGGAKASPGKSLTETIVSAAEIAASAKNGTDTANGSGTGSASANGTPGTNIRQQSGGGKTGTGQTPKNSTGTQGPSDNKPPEDPPPPPKPPRRRPPGPPKPPEGSPA